MVDQIIESKKDELHIELMHRGLTKDQAKSVLKIAKNVLQKRFSNVGDFENIREMMSAKYKQGQNQLVIDLAHDLATHVTNKMGNQFELKAVACSHYIVTRVREEMIEMPQVLQADKGEFATLMQKPKTSFRSFFQVFI